MNDRNKQIAEEAAHEALRFIQKKLGTDDGGFAGIYWSADRWEALVTSLAYYTDAEERFLAGDED
jgi:hypothetical protein